MLERRRSLRNDSAFVLAILYTVGFLGMCFVVVLREISPESRAIVQQLISIMSMIQAAIAGYFYGASKSATESNQATARIAEAAGPAAALAAAGVPAKDVTVAAQGDVTVLPQPPGDKP